MVPLAVFAGTADFTDDLAGDDDEEPLKRFLVSVRLEPRLEIAEPELLPDDEPLPGDMDDVGDVEETLDEELNEEPIPDEPEPDDEPPPEEPPIEAVDPPPLLRPPPPPLLPPPLRPPVPPPLRLRSVRLPNICGAINAAERSAEMSPEIRIVLTISPAAIVAVRTEAISALPESLLVDARFTYSQAPSPAAAAIVTNSSHPKRRGFPGAGVAT